MNNPHRALLQQPAAARDRQAPPRLVGWRSPRRCSSPTQPAATATSTSFAALGYSDLGLDDGWEACGTGVNGSYHDPTGKLLVNTTRFPSMTQYTAAIHALNLTAGWCAREAERGEGRGRGWAARARLGENAERQTPLSHCTLLPLCRPRYLNCDGCSEANYHKPTARYDAVQCVELGFDSIKIDDQVKGPNHNITEWAASFNATVCLARCLGSFILQPPFPRWSQTGGRALPHPFLPMPSTLLFSSFPSPQPPPTPQPPQGKQVEIEDCLDKNPQFMLTDPEHCPLNFYRTSPDNGPNFLASMGNIQWTLPFLNVTAPVPAARQGCYAYPDMLTLRSPAVGTASRAASDAAGCSRNTAAEERSIFGAWTIVSSPLVLGFDVGNDTEVEHLWPLVANPRALDINWQWRGEAGRLLKRSGVAQQFKREISFGERCEAQREQVFDAWLVLSKRLAQPEGGVAVLAVNIGDAEATVSLSLEELRAASGTTTAASFAATEVWSGSASATVSAAAPATWKLASHDSAYMIFAPDAAAAEAGA